MKTRFFLLLTILCSWPAWAHVGSPDVFYDGPIGPYAAQVIIRMPGVVPGRALISVRAQTTEAVTVSFRPLYFRSAVSNAPPADIGILVTSETNLYSGELWLMSVGAYSIDISVQGKSGHGSVQIPVTAVASQQLPLPPYLGKILGLLGILLFAGGVAIVAAAASESTLPPGVIPGASVRRRRYITAGVTTVIFILLLIGGKKWWNSEEREFRTRLRDGGWPDLEAEVHPDGTQRVLMLTIGKKDLAADEPLDLAPDHGKLLHFFLVREPLHDAFAHIHPIRTGNQTFEVAIPPLPEGNYEMFCDLTLETSGASSTATNLVHFPPPPPASAGKTTLAADPDDSWSENSSPPVHSNAGADAVYQLPDGYAIIWKSHSALRINQDAALNFEVRDASGQPAALEPYMGMMSHVAVLRSDGKVFAHLHPSGNFSMAAQAFFDAKVETEANGGSAMPAGMHHHHHVGMSSLISLPYQFPSPGEYRLWVQVKANGRILTGIFDTTVSE